MSRKLLIILSICFGGLIAPGTARAEFIITSAVVEMVAGGPGQADIEIVSRGNDTDYIDATVNEVVDPGRPAERRVPLDDPTAAGLIVTPAKIILPSGGRKVLRFVLLHPPDAQEHIYRVDLKPVVSGLQNKAQIGLKILVGYEVLVIVRPAQPQAAYSAQRQGKILSIANTGNTNLLFENGSQCAGEGQCTPAPVVRVYPGTQAKVMLPTDGPADYTIWDGTSSVQKKFD